MLPFLRAKKYKVAEALKCVNKFSSFWYRRRDVVEGVCGDSPGVRHFQGLNISRQLCGKDVNGNTVVVMRLGNMDMEKFQARDNSACADTLRVLGRWR